MSLFEKMLIDKLQHLQRIVYHPKVELDREKIKRHASQVRRIIPETILYLSHHPEDCQTKLEQYIIPRHLITTYYEENIFTYENNCVASMLEQFKQHLDNEIRSLKNLEAFLESLDNRDMEGRYHLLNYRFCKLYDINQIPENSQYYIGNRIKSLEELRDRLVRLQHTDFYRLIKKENQKISIAQIKTTNIFKHDGHYRQAYLLWKEYIQNKTKAENEKKGISRKLLSQRFFQYGQLLLLKAFNQSGKYNNPDFGGYTPVSEHEAIGTSLRLKHPHRIGLKLEFDHAKHTITVQMIRADHHILFDQTFCLQTDITGSLVAGTEEFKSWIEHFANEHRESCTPVVMIPGNPSSINKLDTEYRHFIQFLSLKKLASIDSKLMIIPTSPLKKDSLETLAQAFEIWRAKVLLGYLETLKFAWSDFLSRILPLPTWLQLIAASNQLRLHNDFRFSDITDFIEICASNLAHTNKKNSQSLHQLHENLNQFADIFNDLAVCGLCGEQTSSLKFSSSEDLTIFQGNCSKCKSDWGSRVCRNCKKTVPFLRSEHFLNQSQEQLRHYLGRSFLSLSCDSDAFVCPHCYSCSRHGMTCEAHT